MENTVILKVIFIIFLFYIFILYILDFIFILLFYYDQVGFMSGIKSKSTWEKNLQV